MARRSDLDDFVNFGHRHLPKLLRASAFTGGELPNDADQRRRARESDMKRRNSAVL
jgi:hypothetical protein